MVAGIGLLGCGVVGSAVVRALSSSRHRGRLVLRQVAVRELTRRRDCVLAADVLTTDAAAVVEHPSVDIVVDVTRGIDPAVELISTALDLGKPVVTCNKEALGAYGPELRRRASAAGVPLLFEGAVVGAVPVIHGLARLVEADEVVKIEGVLNTTTTAVLSYMEDTGATVSQALAEARRWGCAEADTTRDLDGSDAADKLAVLVQHLFGEDLRAADVHRLGIDVLTRDQILGTPDRSWRLVATAVRGRCARVEPAALRREHLFARLQGPQSAVTITAERAGAITLIGTGAGGEATASAVVADLLTASQALASKGGRQRALVEPCLRPTADARQESP